MPTKLDLRLTQRAAARNVLLDTAAEMAKTDPHKAVMAIVSVLNTAIASDDNAEVKNIMDGATERGFFCEFWPMGRGAMGVRVEWVPASEKGK